MRVLITGARGQVGHELVRLAPESFVVTGLGSNELDITNRDAINEVITRLDPDLVINAAAYTAVDKAESEPDLAYAINRDGVAHLGEAAHRLGIPLLHISTDYVFSGDATKPYTEQDATCPKGVYGSSKLAGEQALAEIGTRHLILRTSWVFGAHGQNFVKTMLRLGQERKELSIVADQIGGPTSALSIAQSLWSLADEYRRIGSLRWGIYHFSGSPACSWYDFAKEIFKQANTLDLLTVPPAVKAITTKEFPTSAKRPAWSVLDSSRLEMAYGIVQSDWRDELMSVLMELLNAQKSHC